MVSIDDLRSTFSKGSLAINRNGIDVYYFFKERWFAQSIDGENKNTFDIIMEECDEFEAEIVKNMYIKLSFRKENFLKDEAAVMYQPVEREISLDEISHIINSSADADMAGKFFNNFTDIDINNNLEVINKLKEIVVNDSPEEIYSIPKEKSWNEMKLCASNIVQNYISSDYEFIPPDNMTNGIIEFMFDDEMKNVFTISGSIKDNLSYLSSMSSCIDIEGLVTDGYLNISYVK